MIRHDAIENLFRSRLRESLPQHPEGTFEEALFGFLRSTGGLENLRQSVGPIKDEELGSLERPVDDETLVTVFAQVHPGLRKVFEEVKRKLAEERDESGSITA